MGRRIRVHPPPASTSEHKMGSSGTHYPKCHGLGFHEEHYTVVIGREPWSRFNGFSGDFFSSAFCRCLSCYSAVVILTLLLLLLHFTGSRPPKTNLEALIVHDFNLTARYDPGNATELRVAHSWEVVNGELSVVFQARNPSVVVGFQHLYATTRVSAFYQNVLLGRAEVARFIQGERSARNVSSDVVISEQCVNATTAASLRGEMRDGSVALRVAVDASVMVKRLWWQGPQWFNFSCLVYVNTTVSGFSTNMVGNVCT